MEEKMANSTNIDDEQTVLAKGDRVIVQVDQSEKRGVICEYALGSSWSGDAGGSIKYKVKMEDESNVIVVGRDKIRALAEDIAKIEQRSQGEATNMQGSVGSSQQRQQEQTIGGEVSEVNGSKETMQEEPLSIGRKVRIVETKNVVQRATYLIGKIGTIESVPTHPNTWYTVSFPEVGIKATKFQATALQPVYDNGFDSFPRPRRSPSKSGRRPSSGGSAEKNTAGPESYGNPGTCLVSETDPNLWVGETVIIISEALNGQKATLLRTGNGWIQLLLGSGEQVARRAYELALPEYVTKENIKTLEAQKVATSQVRPAVSVSSSSGGTSRNALIGETVLIMQGSHSGKQGVITSGGNGYFCISFGNEEVRKRRPQFEVISSKKTNSNGNDITHSMLTNMPWNDSTATAGRSNLGAAYLGQKYLSARVLVLSTGEAGQVFRILDGQLGIKIQSGKRGRYKRLYVDPADVKIIADYDSDKDSDQDSAELIKPKIGLATRMLYGNSNTSRARARENSSSPTLSDGGRAGTPSSFASAPSPAYGLGYGRFVRRNQKPGHNFQGRRGANLRGRSRSSRSSSSRLPQFQQKKSKLETAKRDRQDTVMYYLNRANEKMYMYTDHRPDLKLHLDLIERDCTSDYDDDAEYVVSAFEPELCKTCKLEKLSAIDSCWNPACWASPVFQPGAQPLGSHNALPSNRDRCLGYLFAVPSSPRRNGYIDVPESSFPYAYNDGPDQCQMEDKEKLKIQEKQQRKMERLGEEMENEEQVEDDDDSDTRESRETILAKRKRKIQDSSPNSRPLMNGQSRYEYMRPKSVVISPYVTYDIRATTKVFGQLKLPRKSIRDDGMNGYFGRSYKRPIDQIQGDSNEVVPKGHDYLYGGDKREWIQNEYSELALDEAVAHSLDYRWRSWQESESSTHPSLGAAVVLMDMHVQSLKEKDLNIISTKVQDTMEKIAQAELALEKKEKEERDKRLEQERLQKQKEATANEILEAGPPMLTMKHKKGMVNGRIPLKQSKRTRSSSTSPTPSPNTPVVSKTSKPKRPRTSARVQSPSPPPPPSPPPQTSTAQQGRSPNQQQPHSPLPASMQRLANLGISGTSNLPFMGNQWLPQYLSRFSDSQELQRQVQHQLQQQTGFDAGFLAAAAAASQLGGFPGFPLGNSFGLSNIDAHAILQATLQQLQPHQAQQQQHHNRQTSPSTNSKAQSANDQLSQPPPPPPPPPPTRVAGPAANHQHQ